MISWNPTPYIFVHIPKCGGTSVECSLISGLTEFRKLANMPEDQRERHWLPGAHGLQHSRLAEYEAHFLLGDYFKFSFVRNPWDRAVSHILYLERMGWRIFSTGSFKERIELYCKTTARLKRHDLGLSQIDYLTNRGNDQPHLDYIGRFETLCDDFANICQKIGLTPIPLLSHHLNSHRKLHYSHFFDDESAEWIRVRFAKDIDHFGYKFESMQPRRTTSLPGQISK